MNDAPKHDELPLPDYDHIPLGTLPTRITGLDEAGLNALLAYEREHGNRLPVVQVLESRLDAVRQGAEVSDQTVPDTPEVTESQQGSPVSPETAGPKINPPFEGVPTNPGQPRK
jgi:hypothetical protein